MRAKKTLLALSVALLSLTGCKTMMSGSSETLTETTVEVEQVRVESKPERTNRESTLSWDNIGRAGAAYHQPDYVHVLGGDGLTSFQVKADTTKLGSKDKLAAYAALRQGQLKNDKTLKGKGYSMYELSRWERYCDLGKGMDEKDWRFVQKEGYDNIPLDAIGGSCLRPTYRMEGYMAAWVRYCTSSPQLTYNDRRIVSESSRPYSEVNPCKALLK